MYYEYFSENTFHCKKNVFSPKNPKSMKTAYINSNVVYSSRIFNFIKYKKKRKQIREQHVYRFQNSFQISLFCKLQRPRDNFHFLQLE